MEVVVEEWEDGLLAEVHEGERGRKVLPAGREVLPVGREVLPALGGALLDKAVLLARGVSMVAADEDKRAGSIP